MGEYRPMGAMEFLKAFHNEITIKKLVALFDNYHEAKSDLLLDFSMRFELDISDMQNVIEGWEQICDMESWFDELGTPEANR